MFIFLFFYREIVGKLVALGESRIDSELLGQDIFKVPYFLALPLRGWYKANLKLMFESSSFHLHFEIILAFDICKSCTIRLFFTAQTGTV